MVQTEILAAVVSVESGFDPLAIRLNSDAPRPGLTQSKAEAIEAATTLVAEGHSVDLGLGGVSTYDLPRLGLSISDLFDPCLNLKATGTLLDRYYRAAVATGATGKVAESVMLRAYYGQGDAEVGAMVGYDRRITDEQRRLAGRLSSLILETGAGAGGLPTREARDRTSRSSQGSDEIATAANADVPAADPAKPAQTWDVFGQARQSTVLIFPR
ncbi:type IV secretion system protein VirB1 [Rhizobium sp. PP-F2F-G36]|nr:type IV secretion system protein VirB1 [Rhizobium sp. PP-F2F-G36]